MVNDHSKRITNYLTANAIASQKVENEDSIKYGKNTGIGAEGIEHVANREEFKLTEGRTYQLSLFISSNSEKPTPFYFSIKLNDQVMGAVHSAMGQGYNGATTYLCFTAPEGKENILTIVNACGERVSSINSSIGILEIS